MKSITDSSGYQRKTRDGIIMDDIIDKYLNPDQDIIQAIADNFILIQLLNQNGMDQFEEYTKTSKFSGNLFDFATTRLMDEFVKSEGKPWEYIVKAYNLRNSCVDKIDPNVFLSIPDEQLAEFSTMIKKGTIARKKINDWIPEKDLKNFGVIHDASKVKLSTGASYSGLDILEIADIKTNDNGGLVLYKDILKLKSLDGIINYFKNTSISMKSGVLLTAIINEGRPYKSIFYIFVLYNNKLYSISNQGNRLNLENTEGDRNPDRYIERKYENMQLPLYLLYEKEKFTADNESTKNSETTALAFFDENPDTILSTWDAVFKQTPWCYYWIKMLTLKIFDFMENEDIVKGMIPSESVKLLKKTNESGEVPFTTEQRQGKGKYLIDIYGSNITAITASRDLISTIITTKDQTLKLIEYKRRQDFANEIRSELTKDYEQKHVQVYESIKKLIETKSTEFIISKALEKKTYPYTRYHSFGSNNGKQIDENRYTVQGKIAHTSDAFNSTRMEHRPEHLLLKYNTEDILPWSKNMVCEVCGTTKKKMFVNLNFLEWTQMEKFFEIPIETFPKEMKNHLHQQNELYVGNTILDDVDPIDTIMDTWFRYRYQGEARFQVSIPICKRCYNKIMKKINDEQTTPKEQ